MLHALWLPEITIRQGQVADSRDIGSYVADAKRAVAEKVNVPAGYQLVRSGQFESITSPTFSIFLRAVHLSRPATN